MKENIAGVKLIIIFFGMQFVAGIIAGTLTFNMSLVEKISFSLTLLCWFEIGFIYLLYRRYKNKIKSTLNELRNNLSIVVSKLAKYIGMYFIVIFGVGIIDSILFSQYADFSGENQAIIEAIISEKISLWIILSMVINAPIIEEYIFRYGAIDKLFSGLRPYTRLISSALLFAMIHIGFTQMFSLPFGAFIHLLLAYLPTALVLGYIYMREKNLIYSILVHAFNNIIGLILIILTVSN